MIDETNITPINEKKIDSLASAYKKMPKNRFSKSVVIFCLGISTLSVVVSFILLLIGIDSSGILNPSLIFWGSELFILGAKNVFSKEERAQDIIFETIAHDVQDGKLYDKKTGQVVTTEDEYTASDNINTTTTETVTTTTFTETTTITETDSNDYNDNNGYNNDYKDEVIEEVENESIKDSEDEPIKDSVVEQPKKKRGRPKKEVKTSNDKFNNKKENNKLDINPVKDCDEEYDEDIEQDW